MKHYADFSGRCPLKPYWSFVVLSQLIVTLLFVPIIFHEWGVLVHSEAFTSFVGSLMNTNMDATQMQYFIENEAGVLINEWMAQWGNTLGDAAWWVGGSALLAGVLCLFFTLPTWALTVCRLRDAGSSLAWLWGFVVYFSYEMMVYMLPLMRSSVMDLLVLVYFCLMFVLLLQRSKPLPTAPEHEARD